MVSVHRGLRGFNLARMSVVWRLAKYWKIGPLAFAVAGGYPVEGCKGNHGMTLDPEHHRAFLVCEENDLMAAFDLDRHKVIATLPIPAGGDVIKFDPGLQRIYVACYGGAISVIEEVDGDHYCKLEDFKVQMKVHSLAVDQFTHRVYAPEQEEDGRPVSRMIVYDATPKAASRRVRSLRRTEKGID